MSTDRLDAICRCLFPAESIADVGCDHGLVCEYAAKRALAPRIYACDISEKCLQKARDRLQGYPCVSFYVADGLQGVPRPEIAVICGMGGLMIQKILSAITYKPYCVLGAHKNAPELRRFLTDNGYGIVKDFPLCDGGVWYDVICAREGKTETDEIGLQEGVFYRDKSEERRERLLQKIEWFSRFPATEKNQKILALAKEALSWQS